MEAEIIVSCPYNPAHRIRRFKLMTHMIKCKKSSNNAENKVECPLDKSHIVDRECLKVGINLYAYAFAHMHISYIQDVSEFTFVEYTI